MRTFDRAVYALRNEETIMFKRTGFPRLFGALALVSSVLATAPALAASNFPTGTYALRGVGATATFDNKGQVRVNKRGVMEVAADYVVKGDQLRLTDKSGPWACTKAGEQTATYRWKYDGGVLAFTKVADKCKPRADTLTKYVWKRQL
jgi:hypothetical protein